ncbi:hypothetical protein ACIQWB_35235 [Streptomyces olivaceus]|uniref:hypothetical protein n=1 Tax=Streptomyces olivaceus TaxID=47716 RepID=UPI00380D8AFE
MTEEYRWRTVDFRPAPDGWRTAWITRDGLEICTMPGWLIREEIEHASPNSDGQSTGYRDVIASRIDHNGIEPIETVSDASFWYILAPGEDVPTSTEVAAEIDRRKPAQATKKT